MIPEPPIDPPEYTIPTCPICGAEADEFYENDFGAIIGCPECIKAVDAWEKQAEAQIWE